MGAHGSRLRSIFVGMNSAAQASERPMHNHSRFCFTVSSPVCDMHERFIAIVLPPLHAARAIHDRCKTRHWDCCGGILLLSPSRPIDVENPCKPHARNSCTFPFINTACIESLQATTTCMEPFNLPRFLLPLLANSCAHIVLEERKRESERERERALPCQQGALPCQQEAFTERK